MDDWYLLNQYVNDGSEKAFEELVLKYSNMVYSSALRRVGSKEADDVTQAVFIIMARKAKHMHKKKAKSLAGWLYKTTKYAASEVARSRKRRHDREEAAMEMQKMIAEEQKAVRPIKDTRELVDSVLDDLSKKDREAIILRFLQGASFAEVGTLIGISENTATKRVARALEKMRSIFADKGVIMSVPMLTTFLTDECVEAAVPELITTCTALSSGVIHTEAGILAEGVSKVIFMEHVKVITTAACTFAVLGTGVIAAVQNIPFDLEKKPVLEKLETFNLSYMARNILPDNSMEFQLNTPDNEKTYFAKIGDVIDGYKITEHRSRTEDRNVHGIAKPQKIEVSELILIRGQDIIVLNIDSHKPQQKTSHPHQN